MRRRTVLAVFASSLLAVPGLAAAATSDGPVTVDAPYVKANGRLITADDAISVCGTNLRQQNEPSVAIDPKNPAVVVAGSNDYCSVERAGGTWAGYYRSTDSGRTWTNSLLPGYPTDNSPEGQASPLHAKGITNAGDPVQAWDNDGRLFYMGNAFNRAKPQNASVWVATYDQDGAHYVGTVLVSSGTPALSGKFNDKTSIEVDRGASSRFAGNVYVAWSVFQGSGNNEIMFARSTDHGATFSHPVKISTGSKDNQYADIAVNSDGTVNVVWRQFDSNRGHQQDAVMFVRSTDGGATFSPARQAVAGFDTFDAADNPRDAAAAEEAHDQAFENADGPESEASEGGARDCGSGPLACVSGYTFFRHDTQPRVTADPKGDPKTLYLVYDAVKPSTEVPSTSSYNSAPVASDGTLMVGQGATYFSKSVDGGSTWSSPVPISDVNSGHQFFPDINADGGYLYAVWSDSRNDPCYSVQSPPGNCAAVDQFGFHTASPGGGLDAYGAVSTNGGASWTVSRLSTQSHQPNYEMFGDRGVPFQGDYNYVSNVGSFAYRVWTDNRQVVPGVDPRSEGGQGFDVRQCRTPATGPDTCPNEGGLDQDIFGAAAG
ncbi:sialidase family protein [Amycolatopsis taiwanensis]|uniref:sialidase family protein n=1 Tax=Amycolatopsis taiwanensis TaxID=342230 RepID=UPI0004B997C6|nr:sialidase family protein [Amycolatopsis taiwanensis]